MILISAPAGFGKTTLLSVWLNQCPYAATWISLDEGDNDPARFLSYLVHALQKVSDEIGQAVLPMLQAPQVLSTQVLLMQLISDLDRLQEPFFLVLDDYHVIQDPVVHQAVNFLLEQLPWQMHLVVSTRADPPLPLARLRARSQMLEVRTADLCFSTEDTQEYLNREMGLSISLEDIDTITARTEGWIAGLQMAAVSMQGRQDTSHFIQNFAGSNRHILDYLMEEVLERQSQAVIDFLLKTCILSELNAGLCDTVADQTGSQVMLEWLDRSNLFIVPLDDRRFEYRYHHLFADLLRQRLKIDQPQQIPALHLRASQWYQANGSYSNAIEHAFSASDFDQAARLIEQTADRSLMHGEVKTFLGWVERVPESSARRHPLLCIYHAEALLLSGRPVEPVASRLEGAPEYEAVQALMASNLGDVELSKKLSQRVLENLPQESAFLRGAITSSLGVGFLLSGDVEPAIQTFQAAAEIARQNGYLFLEVIALCRLGQLYMLKADLNSAELYLKKSLERSKNLRGEYLPIASMPLSHFAYLQREWNDLESASTLIQKSIQLCQASGGFWSVDCYLIHAVLLQAQGEFNLARQAMAKARHIASQTVANQFDDIYTAAFEAWLHTMQGNLVAAWQWVKDNDLVGWGSTVETLPHHRYRPALFHLVELEKMTLARIYLAQGNFNEALSILGGLLSEMERLGRKGRAIENLALQSLAYQGIEQRLEALEMLDAALSIAEPGGFMRTFLNEGTPMLRLLEAALARKAASPYILKLLDGFAHQKDAGSAVPKTGDLIEPLSKRELEVLQLIADGLTNAEIARKLYISLSTVKGHATNIFGKLNANNRTQAVSRARSLGLLPDD